MTVRPSLHSGLLLVLLAFAGTAMAQSVAPYDQLPPDRVLYVAPGQTLEQLVRRAYPQRPGDWSAIRQWIVAHNPHAFADADESRLRGAVRLRLPSASEFAARQPRQPGEEVRLVFDERFLFVNPAQSLADLVPRIYPEQRALWGEIIEAIQDNNPTALQSGDARSEIARGTRIRIPQVVQTGVAAKPSSEPEPVVGRVVAASGRVVAIGGAGQRRPLQSGDRVRRGDRIETMDGASARIELNDGEELTLRGGSGLRLRDWRLPETGPGQRVIELVRGGLRAVTGAIGNRSGDDYRTITPTATLGVRGTDYALRLCASGECRNASDRELAAGLYVGVASGRISLLNGAGELTVDAGGYGFVAEATQAPVQVDVSGVPAVYQAEELAASERSADEPEEGGSAWWALGLLLLLAL